LRALTRIGHTHAGQAEQEEKGGQQGHAPGGAAETDEVRGADAMMQEPGQQEDAARNHREVEQLEH
jgi:hypothetical protein